MHIFAKCYSKGYTSAPLEYIYGFGLNFSPSRSEPTRAAALGLGEDLLEHAQYTNSIPYHNWTGTLTRRSIIGKNFGRAFTDAMSNAERIHFNLNGIEDLAGSYAEGRAGFRYEWIEELHEFVPRNATNTDLTTIVREPGWLNKTTFWRNRQVVNTDDLLREIFER